jgi:flagellar basal body-associated protein FliL
MKKLIIIIISAIALFILVLVSIVLFNTRRSEADFYTNNKIISTHEIDTATPGNTTPGTDLHVNTRSSL